MLHPRTPILAASLCLTLAACADKEPARRDGVSPAAPRTAEHATAPAPSRPGAATPPSTQPASFTGTLRGSAVAIGGETTGWRLEGDNQTGGIDVDVSKVRERAQSLDGKRVNLPGKMTTRDWPERGTTQVLVVERIEEAARGPATRGAPGGSR